MKLFTAAIVIIGLVSSSATDPLVGAKAVKGIAKQTAGVAGLAETNEFADEAAIAELWDAVNTVIISIFATIEKFTGLDHAFSQLLSAIILATLTTPLLKLNALTNPGLFIQKVGPITNAILLTLGLIPIVGGLGALQALGYYLGQGFLNLIPPQPYY
ncbi:unnamed protein product [Acanthoscelides obtectus]|uniref:Uncharacterized protein n=1 Tax=Acanthoscelides obtectus TaxID=200917 RepID=A0A9P0M4K8_ACAOB|nr:unnamed protein product [Acanthoscelides obtectus]CAK1670965.1 hypothetical protein AOBTE_LOCUS27953 [Acanthoscelides obtectus]